MTSRTGGANICRPSPNRTDAHRSSTPCCRGCATSSSGPGSDLALIDWLAGEIGIATPCHRASELDVGGDRNERLINLCRRFGATRYLSGNAAQDYLDEAQFAAAGIEVVWHNYVHPSYAQQHGEFIPYLSVLDLILNVGRESLVVLSQ
jgi:hypothetical protein